MKNFDRQYRLAAGKAGSTGFEIGSGKRPLHVSFSVEKADTNSQNTAKVTIWNLNDEHLAELSKNDCVVVLHAGYGDTRPLIFTGVVTFATTKADGADRSTEIELVDNRIEVRDTYVSVGYSGAVNCKTLIQDTADQMGVTVSFSYNAEFKDIPNGYSYVGPARNVLTKACETSGLVWSINNGVLQVKRPGDTMSREVYELSAETGLLGLPERVQISNEDKGYSYGWDVEYLMNAAIGLDDYVYLNSNSNVWLGNERRVILENELFYICVEDNEWSLAVELVQKDGYSDCQSAWLAGLQKRRYREYLDSMKKALLARLPSIGIRTGAWTSGTITREEAGVC